MFLLKWTESACAQRSARKCVCVSVCCFFFLLSVSPLLGCDALFTTLLWYCSLLGKKKKRLLFLYPLKHIPPLLRFHRFACDHEPYITHYAPYTALCHVARSDTFKHVSENVSFFPPHLSTLKHLQEIIMDCKKRLNANLSQNQPTFFPYRWEMLHATHFVNCKLNIINYSSRFATNCVRGVKIKSGEVEETQSPSHIRASH